MADVTQFLAPRWREHLEVYGSRRKLGMGYEPYPKSAPRACRRDAWPEGGGNPGSDLDLIRKQYLDAYYQNFNKGEDEFGREVLNPAGVDLTPDVARSMGLEKYQNAWVWVRFPWVHR